MITKGPQVKKMRIMAKGRTGVGYKRSSHLRLSVAVADFDKLILNAKTHGEKKHWQKRKEIAGKLKGTFMEEAEIVAKK